MKFLLFLALIALLISVVAAHHSVRTKKPATEEERIQHHLLHRRQPQKSLVNDLSIQPDEDAYKGQKSKSYHFKVGPEYPDHSQRRRDYKKGGEHSVPMNARQAEAFRRKSGQQ